MYFKLRNDLQPKAFSHKCLEYSMDVDSQHIHSEILQRQLKEFEMQLDIANIKIIVSYYKYVKMNYIISCKFISKNYQELK